VVFSSVSFLFLFLPLVLVGYHLLFLPVTLGHRRRIYYRLANGFLLLASLAFYFWGEHHRVWIFVGTTGIDFLAALLISGRLLDAQSPALVPGASRTARQKAILAASIVSNVAVLGYFKYFNFGVASYNSIVTSLGLSAAVWNNVAAVTLPLGISFFTFHSMSYAIDVYRGHVEPTRNLIDYACYVLMFPQLVAGPIVRFSYVSKALLERVVTPALFANGTVRFVLGLCKKVLIANNVATAADRIFSLPPDKLSPAIAWLGAAAYTIQIYFDFSGYSDMAIGLGWMLGFELPENFNYPYVARTVREFWRRWHITLSTWFQDYVYIPLGGSWGSPSRTYLNLITVFFLCGLWHGASWTFVVWGLYHGTFLVAERLPSLERLLQRAGPLAHVYTLVVVMIGWVLFRADDFTQAGRFLAKMAGFSRAPSPYTVRSFVGADVLMALIAGVVLSAPIYGLAIQRLDNFVRARRAGVRLWLVPGLAATRIAAVFGMLFVCAMSLATGTHNPFIYFRF
jgi:alginate O-acetyltransferase complex protein AlgI